MSQQFKDKSANVVLVESQGSQRQSMSEALKAAGFKNVQAVSSVQDAYAQMQTETVHWLILPLAADQPINAMHLLGLCVEAPELRHIRISLILDQPEKYVLSKAFDLGAMSWHPKTTNKSDFQAEIDKLLQKMSIYEHNPTLVAADYLRDHLTISKDHTSRLLLESSVNALFPGNPRLMLNLAKAQNAAGLAAQARLTIEQAKIIGPEIAMEADAALLTFAAVEGESKAGPATNVLGITSCIVIDPDDAVRTSIQALLEEMGVNVNSFADGETAWKHLDGNPEPTMVVMEWRIPQLSGPQLIQRIRYKGFHATIIVVHSSLVKPTDLNLLKEISVANLTQKPFDRTPFLKSIVGTIQQERAPTDYQAIERKFRTLLAAGRMRDAKDIIGRFLNDPNIPLGRKALVGAELAFSMGDYHVARSRAFEAIKALGENILTLNIMAKTFLRLGDFGNALKCFEKAQSLSPENIERLCLIAETQTEMADDAAAAKALQEATTLDKDSTQAKEAAVRVAVISGASDLAQKLMSTLESIGDVVSYLNNKAVASARAGSYEAGFELYDKTIKSLPADHELIALVYYNLALAKIRSGDDVGALKVLDLSIDAKSNRSKQKARSLQARLKLAVDKGVPLKLKEDEKTAQALYANLETSQRDDAKDVAPLVDESKATLENLHSAIMDGLNPIRGEICCYMLYNFKGKLDDKLKALFENPPKFQRRATIERPETGGLDRANRAS